MVWPPDKATVSVVVKFFCEKMLRMVVVFMRGDGRLAKVSFCVAKFRLSLLPRGIL